MRRVILFLALILAGLSFQNLTTVAQDMPDVCQEPANILPNCNFNNGLEGWQTFLEDGGANFAVLQGGGECHAPLCPAAYIVTEGHFVGGLYQQVPVQAGNTYYANVIWLVFDSLSNDAGVNGAVGGIGRRIGIDPTGGTDSRSPNIVWSEDNWRNDCKICGVEHVTVTAQAETITVFLRIDDTWRRRAAEKGYAVPPSKDQFWIDDIGLKQVDGSSAPAPATEPPEAAPPTDTPAPAPTTTPPPPEETVGAREADTAETGTQLSAAAETEQTGLVEEDETEPQTETPEAAAGDATEESVTPTAEPPAAAKTIAPPPTLTPTTAPTVTPTSETQLISALAPLPTRPQPGENPEPIPASGLSVGMMGLIGTTACVGGVFIVIMSLALVGLVWLYRLGWSQTKDELVADDFDEAETEFIR